MTTRPDVGERPVVLTRAVTAPPVGRGPFPRRVVAEILAAWVTARFVVFLAYALAHFVADDLHSTWKVPRVPTTGLLGWDAAHYRDIADHGYSSRDELRFFPLVPLLARGLALGTQHVGPVLVVLVNLAALGYAFALVRLAHAEGWGTAVTRRAVWLLSLAPPAFVLVMGYTEAVWGLLAVGVFLGVRTRRWELAAVAGLLAGACRPVGLLLAAPAAIEVARGWAAAGGAERVRRALAVLAPLAGCAAYLSWVGVRYGDALLPYRVQREAGRHGGSGDPFRVVWDAATGTFHGRVGTGLHVPWLLALIVLLVVMGRRLPASYTAFSALTLAATLSGTNLDSLERYAFGAFPFIVVVAGLTAKGLVWRLVLIGTTGLLVLYATLAFFLLYVP